MLVKVLVVISPTLALLRRELNRKKETVYKKTAETVVRAWWLLFLLFFLLLAILQNVGHQFNLTPSSSLSHLLYTQYIDYQTTGYSYNIYTHIYIYLYTHIFHHITSVLLPSARFYLHI
uniref:Uncharacterized protein n=1 Tax=Octopus bimaculoides TaxID=37653 RepID=A0A0L8HIW3_OCTBM